MYQPKESWVPLSAIAQSLVKGYETALDCQYDDSVDVLTDLDVVTLCVTDVVYNAVKYRREGTKGQIRILGHPHQQLIIAVTNAVDPFNAGVPRTSDDCERCFEVCLLPSLARSVSPPCRASHPSLLSARLLHRCTRIHRCRSQQRASDVQQRWGECVDAAD